MNKKPVLVVMAAGMGSRYGGLKQIDPVGNHGQIIIDYSLYDARRAGFETVVFIIKHEIEEAFRQAVGDRISKVMEVRYVFQELDDLPQGYSVPEGRTKPWGTAHAVLAARHVIDAPFAVINADDYYGPEAFSEIYRYLSTHQDDSVYRYAMVGYLLKNTVTEHGYVSRGVCVENPDHTLQSVTERTKIELYDGGIHFDENGSWVDVDPDSIVSMNLWGFSESFLRETSERFSAFLDRALREMPKILQKRAILQISGFPPPPVEQNTVSAPYFCFVSTNLCAMISIAFSQEIRRHLLAPRFPTRIIGYLFRLGWYRA